MNESQAVVIDFNAYKRRREAQQRTSSVVNTPVVIVGWYPAFWSVPVWFPFATARPSAPATVD